jgi:hypothetical protein
MSNGRSNINIVGNTTSGANTGTGAGLYGGKCNTNTLLFKTISALGTGIAVINCNNQIYISGNTGGGGTYTFGNGLCNLGGLVRLGGLMTCETVFDGDASFGITYCKCVDYMLTQQISHFLMELHHLIIIVVHIFVVNIVQQ